jgi:HNH endonuclease
LPPADGAVVLQALRAALGDLDHPHDAKPDLAGDERPDPYKVPVGDLADALVEVAGAYLRGKITAADNADVYQVQIHVVPEILDRDAVPAGTARPGITHPCRPGRCHLEDGPANSPADAQRIACSATLSAMLHDPGDGSVLDAGRRSRSATAAIRRAVRERDGARCCFPGCDSRRTDLHHIVWWRNGGTTSLDNLLPVCKRHHTLIHAKGYLICRQGPGRYSFTDPSSGTVIALQGTLPEAAGPIDGTHDAAITDRTIQQALGDRLDLHFAVWVALQNGRDPENEQYLHQRHETALAA